MRLALLYFLCQPFYLLSQEVEQVANSINQFGLDVGYNLSQSPDYLVSPTSISTALGMTYLGAKGLTKEQFEKVLYFPKDAQFLSGFQMLISELENSDPNTSISMANKLWAGRGSIDLNPEFVSKNKSYFGSELETLDFSDAELGSRTINNWVADNTENKIKDLISPDFITSDVVLVLTNAIYFKSNWAHKFNPKLTRSSLFTNENNKRITVDFMSGDGYFNTYEDRYVDILELPYANGEFSFLIILPKATMADLEDYLFIENYKQWMQGLSGRRFNLVQVPKFKSSTKLELKPMLAKMGMPSAFQGANFEGMGKAGGRIELSAVIHQTFMEFNEEGTEASAATAVGAVARSTPPPPKEFIADRPFLYILRHIKTNSILFIGKMSNPSY